MMELAEPDTLIVRRLPEVLTERNLNELFHHFGAQEVRKEKPVGRMRKSTILVKFRTHEDATYAMMRLHQLKVLNQRLVVEYADFSFLPQICPQSNSKVEQTRNIDRRHPSANEATVKNISSQLLSNSEFYGKVIELMQSMRLPLPFRDNEEHAPDAAADIEEVEMEELYKEDTEESELETDGEEQAKEKEIIPGVASKRKKIKQLKRPTASKLLSLRSIPLPERSHPTSKPVINVSEVFEQACSSGLNIGKKLEVKISTGISTQSAEEPTSSDKGPTEGFGSFAPIPLVEEEKLSDNPPGDDDYKAEEFISRQKILTHKLQEEEMKLLPVFKNYAPGTPSSRLYIKNLAKTIRESDLKHIYGRYVTWTSEEERNMFDIRLMTEGRMKGQAFVTLPSVAQAEKAVAETNGLMLQGKPLVVQFARSATANKAAEPEKT